MQKRENRKDIFTLDLHVVGHLDDAEPPARLPQAGQGVGVQLTGLYDDQPQVGGGAVGRVPGVQDGESQHPGVLRHLRRDHGAPHTGGGHCLVTRDPAGDILTWSRDLSVPSHYWLPQEIRE